MARYRALSTLGDYTFGQSAANFLVNSPTMVGQSVQTRLLLWRGEWFLDTSEGTPWLQNILGTRTKPVYDLAIQERILATPGVKSIVSYTSQLQPGRKLLVQCTVDTIYSADAVSTANVQVTL